MGKITSHKERLAEGMRLEKSGELEAAMDQYRKVTDKDPLNEEAVSRLLVVYRKRKDYREELALINRVLAAYEQEDKMRQEKWIREHSKAAVAGTAVFQKLGGASVSGFGADPMVAMLARRRQTVERKISGKKGAKRSGNRASGPAVRRRGAQANRDEKNKEKDAARKKEELRRQAAAAERRQKAELRRAELAAKKAELAAKKAEKMAAKQAEKMAAKQAREAAARKAQQEKRQPSLFVITLIYQVPLDEIDSAMAAHMDFLNKHYKQGDFLVSGRQEPRVGGIIVSRGKDRAAVERMMQADPFVKQGLATVEIVEFKASQMGKGLNLLA